MDYKALFLKCFPTKQVWRDFQAFRKREKARSERSERLRQARLEQDARMVQAGDDPGDDDYDPITEDVWQKVYDG